ncbi:hypothetical protein T439DRAFT_353377 [Meredithblackwellia eburnea MCA 4105]
MAAATATMIDSSNTYSYYDDYYQSQPSSPAFDKRTAAVNSQAKPTKRTAEAASAGASGNGGVLSRYELDGDEKESDEDLLRARLELGNHSERAVEDDYEDLRSLPVAKALQPRRPSRGDIKTFLPSSPSSASLASSSHLGEHDLPPPLPTSSSTNIRLPSNFQHQQRRAASEPLGGADPTPSAGEAEEEHVEWETLQTGPSSPTHPTNLSKSHPSAASRPPASGFSQPQPSTKRPKPRAASSSPERSRSNIPSATRREPVEFPTGSKGTGSKQIPSGRTPSTSRPSGPRTRAQTQAGLGSGRPPPSTSQPPTTVGQGRKRSASSAPKRKVSNPPFRDRDSLDGEREPAPPWLSAPAVELYRSESGLDYKGRPEDLVLPAVARRLEAERLANAKADELINQWGKDGTPQAALPFRSQQRKGQQNTERPEGVEVEMEEITPAAAPSSDSRSARDPGLGTEANIEKWQHPQSNASLPPQNMSKNSSRGHYGNSDYSSQPRLPSSNAPPVFLNPNRPLPSSAGGRELDVMAVSSSSSHSQG